MTQLTLFPTPCSGETYWSLAEETGSALRSFYTNRDHSDYTRFAQSCQKFAEHGGYSFVDASNRIHNMFNIKTFGN